MINNIAILLTCYNRKQVTLECLKRLVEQNNSIDMDVFLCDDGSTDGTYESVKEKYPTVHIFKGTGNLFWNRGMLAAWQEACKEKEYDAYIWLNDDVILYENAISELINCSTLCEDKSIICGSFCSNSGEFSYGGRTKNGTPIIPNGTLQNVYWLNGNCVLIPKAIVNKIGLLDKMFQHHLGDFDYGLRAQEAGFNIVTTKRYLGTCAPNLIKNNRARKDGLTIIKRFQRLYSPLGDNPFIQFRYTLRHFGIVKAIKIFISLHVINLLSDSIYHLKESHKD